MLFLVYRTSVEVHVFQAFRGLVLLLSLNEIFHINKANGAVEFPLRPSTLCTYTTEGLFKESVWQKTLTEYAKTMSLNIYLHHHQMV